MLRSLVVGALVVVFAATACAEEKKGYLGLQVKVDENSGAVVVQAVQPDTAAEKAGFKTGDIILKIDDKDVGGLQGFVQAIRDKKPGDKVEIKIKRDDKEMTLKATLGELPKEIDK